VGLTPLWFLEEEIHENHDQDSPLLAFGLIGAFLAACAGLVFWQGQ